MSDNRNDDLLFSDIEKLKKKYSAYNLEEQEQAVNEPVIKAEPTQVEFEAPKPIDTSVFRDEAFDNRDVYSNETDTPQPVENNNIAPIEPVVGIPVEPDTTVTAEPQMNVPPQPFAPVTPMPQMNVPPQPYAPVAPVSQMNVPPQPFAPVAPVPQMNVPQQPFAPVAPVPQTNVPPQPFAPVTAEPQTAVPFEQPTEEKPFVHPTKVENVFSEDFAPVADEFDDLDNDNDISVIKHGTSLFSGSSEKKEQKQKAQKAPSTKKKSKKLLVIILSIAIPIALWVAAFATDLILVNNWYTPFFCIETAEYENGSKNYVGLFYKIQFHVEEDGDISGECIPWFVEGHNDKI